MVAILDCLIVGNEEAFSLFLDPCIMSDYFICILTNFWRYSWQNIKIEDSTRFFLIFLGPDLTVSTYNISIAHFYAFIFHIIPLFLPP